VTAPRATPREVKRRRTKTPLLDAGEARVLLICVALILGALWLTAGALDRVTEGVKSAYTEDVQP
jgi:hypothetical protein